VGLRTKCTKPGSGNSYGVRTVERAGIYRQATPAEFSHGSPVGSYRAGTCFSVRANLLKKLLLFQRGRWARLATASTTCR
jgi:hypothetical protein